MSPSVSTPMLQRNMQVAHQQLLAYNPGPAKPLAIFPRSPHTHPTTNLMQQHRWWPEANLVQWPLEPNPTAKKSTNRWIKYIDKTEESRFEMTITFKAYQASGKQTDRKYEKKEKQKREEKGLRVWLTLVVGRSKQADPSGMLQGWCSPLHLLPCGRGLQDEEG